jgi:signal-transduction protein with cAMP-binding, CBS, and nucleotidyltransferase domain
MVRVGDIIRGRNLFSVQIDQSVADVVRHMVELHVGAILVLEKDELRGLFSERDLMIRVVVERRDPGSTPVREVMSVDLATIDESSTLDAALECMTQRSCRHLPVMSGGKVTGFLSMRDVMWFDLAQKTEELEHLHAYVHGNV